MSNPDIQKLIREMMLNVTQYLIDHIKTNDKPECGEIHSTLTVLVDLAEKLCDAYGHARMPDE